MKMRAFVFALVATLLVSGGCGGPAGGPAGPGTPTGVANPPFEGAPPDDPFVFTGEPGTYGGTLVLATQDDPKSFNALISSETSTTAVTNGPMFTPLLGFDNIAQTVDNGLCSSYASSDDKLVWTFKLRKGVRWSDGEPFTAHDVKFNFDVAFDPKIDNSIKSSFEQSDKSFPIIEVPDDLTIVFKLKEPNALFLDNVGSTYLVPKHKWEKVYKEGNFDKAMSVDSKPEDIVGLGPYRLKEYSAQQRVLLERNPYYWKVDSKNQRLPYVDRVIFVIVPDQNVITTKFLEGELDMHWNVRPEDVGLLQPKEQELGFKVQDLGPGFNVTYIMLNQNPSRSASGKPYVDPVRSAWFRNVKFRQAIAHAIDRQAIIKTSYQGLGTPAYSICPPGNKVWYDDAVTVKYPFDQQKARDLLREVGIEDRDGDGVAEDASGNACTFRLFTNSSNPGRIAAATVVKDNLRAVGIDLNVQPIPFNSMVDALQKTYDWDSLIGGWQSANPPDPVLMRNIISSSGLLYYSNPKQKVPSTPWEARIDELMRLNTTTMDLAERKRQFSEVQKLWSENLPEIDLLVANYYVASKNRVANMRPSPLPLYTYWNVEEIYLKQ